MQILRDGGGSILGGRDPQELWPGGEKLRAPREKNKERQERPDQGGLDGRQRSLDFIL